MEIPYKTNICHRLCSNNKYRQNNALNGAIHHENQLAISMFHVEQFDFWHRFHVKRKPLKPH